MITTNNLHNLKNLLSLVSPTISPYKLNFHIHSTCSDGSLTPTELIRQAIELKIEHIAITDHNTISAYPVITNWISEN